jgi:hypothetical protein
MGRFTRIFQRRPSSSNAAVVEPIAPQYNETSPSTARSLDSKTSLSKRDRVKHKLSKAFTLRRRGGVRTVTINANHHIASGNDSGYISWGSTGQASSHGHAEGMQYRSITQNTASPPMTPMATKDNTTNASFDQTQATKERVKTATTVSTDAGKVSSPVNRLNGTKPLYTNIVSPTLKPTKTSNKLIKPYKSFQDTTARHSLPQSKPKKAGHTRVTSTSIPATATPKLREVFQTLAYDAALFKCPRAISTIAAIEDVLKLSARGIHFSFDPLFSSHGFQFQASQLGPTEKDWLTRIALTRHLDHLEKQRLLHPDDSEVVKTSLFPIEKHHIRDADELYILLDGLVHETLISRSFATKATRLALTTYEFLGGPTAMGKPKAPHQQKPFHTTFFHLAQRATPSRTTALRHLIEAAVYPMPSSVWKGVYYADARAKLLDYYAAYHCTYHDRVSTPPHLTAYKRDFSFVEQRMLLRGKLLVDMQDRFDKGLITDYGLFKNVRGNFFYLPCQPCMDADEFARFVYARVVGSGVRSGEVPGVVVLHPEFDGVFAAGLGAEEEQRVRERLEEELREFERGEGERVREVEDAVGELKARRRAGEFFLFFCFFFHI